ncbi:hypothetical protein A7U60_g3513 [Sanghuangporus baumii]|uniref:Protein kinase domain-containing protein n=1 Tax=Sanghuangporus baumii TaxID=108892 RepID=A0A9Q5N9U7_SANBA|nr:hypothetical protein A7U60_g3513 [Sanghuangporus baumii]
MDRRVRLPSPLAINLDRASILAGLLHSAERKSRQSLVKIQSNNSRSCIDAKRLKDGKIVAIKRIPPYTLEADIACMLSARERLGDPMYHCVPVYDCFPDTRNARGGFFIVMLLLRAFNEPPFAYVDEVDFFRQTLEGLMYIHGHNVAHRLWDLSDGNIRMDRRAMYGKKGFHPSDQDVEADDALKLAKPKTRRALDPRRLVAGNRAQDREVPELSSIVPYDPFAVDIFTLGNVFKRNFLNVFLVTSLFCNDGAKTHTKDPGS